MYKKYKHINNIVFYLINCTKDCIKTAFKEFISTLGLAPAGGIVVAILEFVAGTWGIERRYAAPEN